MLTLAQKQAVLAGILIGALLVVGWLMWLSTHRPTPVAQQPTQLAVVTHTEATSPPNEPLRTTATARPTKPATPTVVIASATASASASASATLPAFDAEVYALPTLDLATPGPQYTPPTAIPTPFPIASKRAGVTNILLMGTDTSFSTGQFRTDTLIVASIDSANRTVTLLTIPRDLLVYIPGIKMDRVNTAVVWGAINQYPGGGIELLKQTLLYNLGIPIDHWLVVDFNGFRHAVDALGGVDIPVSCPLQDWRLKTVPTPQAGEVAVTPDIQDEANWEQYYLEVGVRHMYGDLALWYARSRKSSSDFDRSRRQQQIIRALFREFLAQDGLSDLPGWYERMSPYYDTDMNLPQLLQFAGLAAELEQVQIRSRFIGRKDVYSWTTPGGAAVLLPNPVEIQRTLDEAFSPPASNRASEPYPLVVVKNETRLKSWQALAVDNLAWAGFLPVTEESAESGRAKYHTHILW
ncbi:MAG TPA: LCP family protein [Anaerolineales bacterium]|nr:LCP family protein [Anaerolineales bacterium]